ncbi:MAG: 50S ribosomal protein L25 [Muribaculaceae bacterium]|nr:50S ribosomal protein L25 [Muribaculaceae bacterium]
MKTFNLTAEPRTALGKKATKALRKEGLVPVVLNGGEVVDLPYSGTVAEGVKLVALPGKKSVNGKREESKKGIFSTDLVVKMADIRKLIYTPDIFVIDLNINGTSKKAVLKDIQFHPVTDEVLHIDLLEVYDNKPVVMEVPVQIEGHAAGVKAGGKLTLSMKKLKVKAIYSQMPERVIINVDNLELGQSLQVGALHYEGLELMNAKNAVVCAVQLTRAARGAQATAQK